MGKSSSPTEGKSTPTSAQNLLQSFLQQQQQQQMLFMNMFNQHQQQQLQLHNQQSTVHQQEKKNKKSEEGSEVKETQSTVQVKKEPDSSTRQPALTSSMFAPMYPASYVNPMYYSAAAKPSDTTIASNPFFANPHTLFPQYAIAQQSGVQTKIEDEEDYDEYTDDSDEESGDEPRAKRMKKRGQYTKRACVNCRIAHAACDSGRPCKRCIQLGKTATCVDAERKRTRKRGIEEVDSDVDKFYPSMAEFLPLIGTLSAPQPVLPDQQEQQPSSASPASGEQTAEKKERKRRIRKEKNKKSREQLTAESLLLYNEAEDLPSPHGASLLDFETVEPMDTSASESAASDLVFPSSLSSISTSGSATISPDQLVINDPESPTRLVPSYSLIQPSSDASPSSSNEDATKLPHKIVEAMGKNNNDELVKVLMMEYARQAEEVKQLKALIRHLQQMVLTSPQFTPYSLPPVQPATQQSDSL